MRILGIFRKIKPFTADGFLTGAVSLTVSVFIVKLLGYIYKVPLSHILGDGGMGYFNSAYTVFGFFFLLCSGGVPKAVSIVIAEMGQTHLPKERVTALKTVMLLFLFIGIFLTAAMLIGAGALGKTIGNSGAVYSIMCIAPALLFVSVGGVAKGYLMGVGEITPVAISQVVEGGVKFLSGMLLALITVRVTEDLKVISAATVLGVTLGAAISNIYLLICTNNKNKGIKTEQKNRNSLNKRYIIKRVISVSAPITLASAIMGMMGIIDLALIMQRLRSIGFSESEAGSLYGNYTTLAVPMLNLVIALMTPITVAALPLIAGRFSASDNEGAQKISERVLNLSLFFTLPVSLVLAVFSREILIFLFNDVSAEIAAPLLTLLTPAILFLPLVTVFNTVLEATKRQRYPLISLSIGTLVKLIVSYFLLGNERFGISGAPIGTSFGYSISLLISYVFVVSFLRFDIVRVSSVLKIIIISVFSTLLARAVFILIACYLSLLPSLIISMLFLGFVYILLSILVKSIPLYTGNFLANSTK